VDVGNPAVELDEASGRRKVAVCGANGKLPYDEAPYQKKED